jgi:hypothetical protein
MNWAELDLSKGAPFGKGALSNLPVVTIRHDTVPPALQPSRFLELMVRRVIDATPVDRHETARGQLENPRRERIQN